MIKVFLFKKPNLHFFYLVLLLSFGITFSNSSTAKGFHSILLGKEDFKLFTDSTKIFFEVEQMPVFPGGESEFDNYIQTNVKYPEQAKKNGIYGKVYVDFVINEIGKPTDVKIRSSLLGAGIEEEAIRVIENMPDWSPGLENGKAVKVQFTKSISFDFILAKRKELLEDLKVLEYPKDQVLNYESKEIYNLVDEMPYFIGGEKELISFLKRNTKYPFKARENGIAGTIKVGFVIDEIGKPTNVKIIKGGLGSGLEEEAIRITKAMPNWIPGKLKGKPVKVQMSQFIKFSLQ